ncbi:hypothetical protein IU486_04905 [Streptomyces gardneri]|uniref:hypothetical protein n=1 Tax=Nocardia TaxID=1817 RepID=UPI00135870A0|nr:MULTISPECIES: hypothetical protein [Nocardia]MBF6164115.1 hypothetical protein [Streptomyces gardneri]MBF6203689.1 hypothetical protein [Streptomyces gardneri]
MAVSIAAIVAVVWTMACYFGGARLLVRPLAREDSDSGCARCRAPWSAMADVAERPQVADGAFARPVSNGERFRGPHRPTAMAG